MEKIGAERTDVEIILSVRGGHKEDFRYLVARYQDYLFMFFLRQVGDHQTAEDLTQEVLVKVFLNLPAFEAKAQFSTWLTRIALNQASSYFTSRRYAQLKRTLRLTSEEKCLNTADPESERERRDRWRRFQEALAELPARLREVLILCGLDGKSYEETAGILKIPIGTVRSRLNRARLAIREILPDFAAQETRYETE